MMPRLVGVSFGREPSAPCAGTEANALGQMSEASKANKEWRGVFPSR